MRLKRKLYTFTAYMVSLCMFLVNFGGCANAEKVNILQDTSTSEIDTTQIAEAISQQIDEELQELAERKEEDSRMLRIASSNMDLFVHELLLNNYSIAFDTFEASIILPDGEEVFGIGYSDFACFFEDEEGQAGYFPAGFLANPGECSISDDDRENVLIVNNLDYDDAKYGFVLTYHTEPYMQHCVVNHQYVKYGIDEKGIMSYESKDFNWNDFDSNLGTLYSYDENKNLFTDGSEGEFTVTGVSLLDPINYGELQATVNRILDEQDKNYFTISVVTAVSESKEAVTAYLQSLQEETFLGCNVDSLIAEVSSLSPNQCIRFTPEGHVVVDVGNEIPEASEELARWLVGIGCGVAIAGSIALNVFVPASAPVSGAICGAAMDVFMQIVAEKKSVGEISWAKVAVSATSGALMAWACPMGASKVLEAVAAKTGKPLLSQLAKMGFTTFSNAVISGATNAAFSVIDGGSTDDVFDSFLIGAAVGACCTIAAEALGKLGQAGMKALKNSKPDNWFVKLSDDVATFINDHQVHLKNKDLENILVPKSDYEALQAGLDKYYKENAYKLDALGGAYNTVKATSSGEYTEVNDIPSHYSLSTDSTRSQTNGPSIKMTKEDHWQTASWGSSNEAKQYREVQKALIDKGDYRAAIQMDIDDIHLKFGDKYDKHIEQMLEYAKSIGWW